MKRANGTVCRRCSFLRPLCTGHYFRRLWLSFSPRCRQTVDVDEEAVFASSTPSIPSGALGSSHPMSSNRVRRERRQERRRTTTVQSTARHLAQSFLPVDVSHLRHRQHHRHRHCCRRCCRGRRYRRHRRRHRWQGESEGGTECKVAAATTSLLTTFHVDRCHGAPLPPARACASWHAAAAPDTSLPIFRSPLGWRRAGTAAAG